MNAAFALVLIGGRSGDSFSLWCRCRSECYMRTLRFKRVKPSVGTLAVCASKLQHYAKRMTAAQQNPQLAKQFVELSEQCYKQIDNVAFGEIA